MTISAPAPARDFLRVYPNPWHTLDHEGEPCGTVPFDPVHAGTGRRWVGARIASADLENKPKSLMQRRTRAGRVDTLYSEEPIHRIRWVFEMDEPTLLPPLPPYLAALRGGELLPADEATARRAGVPFLPREEAMSAAAARSIACHCAAHGCEPDQSRWPEPLRALCPSTPTPPTTPQDG